MPLPQYGFRVLVVEDSLIIVKRIWALLMEVDGITMITHAKDGNEALLLAEQIKPDVILLDIKIPGKSGVDVLPLLKARTNAKVIMLTNYSDQYYRNLCSRLGADFFLDKSQEFDKINDILCTLRPVA
ncbi:MAG: response regulator [Bacteroidia bacterium]